MTARSKYVSKRSFILRAASAFALAIALPMAGTLSAGSPAFAASPAETMIENFHGTLLSNMKQAKSLGYAGRAKRLDGIVQRTFGIQTMAQLICGAEWANMSASDRAAVVDALEGWIVANYASRFDDYSGESFVTTGVKDGGRGTVVVNTEIKPQGVKLGYRIMGGKVIDIYLNGSISQMAQWRAEFSSVLKQQGVKGLVQKIKANESQLAR